MRLRPLARTRAGDVETLDAVHLDEGPHHRAGFRRASELGVDDADRLVELLAHLECQRATTARNAWAQDQCAIRILDVFPRPLRIAPALKLCQRVMLGDHPVLGLAARRTPAATVAADLERGIQRTAIDAGLPAREN